MTEHDSTRGTRRAALAWMLLPIAAILPGCGVGTTEADPTPRPPGGPDPLGEPAPPRKNAKK